MGTVERPGRENWLDGLKGFAALLVILGHVLSGYLDAGTFPAAYHSFYALRTWIYSFHMPLFFLISGFTFTLAYWRNGRLRRSGFWRQMGNLVWLYVVFALLLWAVKQIVPDLVNVTYGLEDLRQMFWVPLGNFWYIYVLAVLYLLAAATSVPKWEPWWVLLSAGGAVTVAYLRLDWTALTFYRIVYHLLFFVLGSALCVHREMLSSEKLMGLSCMTLATAAMLYGCFHIRNWYANWRVAIALSTSFVFLWEFYHWKRLSHFPLFQLCGKHCLEIYLLHVFFTAGLRALLPTLGLTAPWVSVWVNFILSTAGCLALAWIFDKCSWSDLIFRPTRLLRNKK
jgi:fucose 4-O-acetylase-like acetyltransferase